MPITVGYDVPFTTTGPIAYASGRGRFLQEQDKYNEQTRQFDEYQSLRELAQQEQSRQFDAGQEYRYVTLQDPAVKDYDEDDEQIRAREVEINGSGSSLGEYPSTLPTGALYEASQYWRIFKEPRDTYRVTLKRKWFYAEMGDIVELDFKVPHLADDGAPFEHSRFGFDTAGEIRLEDDSGGIQLEGITSDVLLLEGDTHRRFLVVGVEEDFDRESFSLILWG